MLCWGVWDRNSGFVRNGFRLARPRQGESVGPQRAEQVGSVLPLGGRGSFRAFGDYLGAQVPRRARQRDRVHDQGNVHGEPPGSGAVSIRLLFGEEVSGLLGCGAAEVAHRFGTEAEDSSDLGVG